MTQENDGWIKMSERNPERGMNIWAYYPEEKNHAEQVTFYDDTHGVSLSATYWKPAHLPAPPKKELTQREEDEKAMTELWNKHWQDKRATMTDYAMACLAYRDAQNREDLKNADSGTYIISGISMNEALSRIRRRCGL